jgi:cation diffusion facilitator family transporter
MAEQGEAARIGLISFLSNLILACIKAATGIIGNSYALIADAIESFADIFSSLFLFFGLRYTQRPADETHPYGHGRLEPLLTFIIVLVLLLSAGWISVQAVNNLSKPQETPEPWTILVIFGIVIWKEGMYQLIMRRAKKIQSSALKAEAWHQRGDAITSVAALIGISIAIFFGPGYEKADEWAALIAAAVILFNAYKILRPAISEFMDEHLYYDLADQIKQISKEVEGVINTEKCYIRKVGTSYVVELHARVNGSISVHEGHEIAHSLKDFICEKLPEISHVSIHIEPA